MPRAFLQTIRSFTQVCSGVLGLSSGRRRSKRFQSGTRRLRLESLEGRRLLTTNIALDGNNNVVITDAASTNNNLTISYVGSGNFTITDAGDSVASSVPGSQTLSANSQTVPVGSTNSIIVNFTDGTDKVTLDLSAAYPAGNAVQYNPGTGANALVLALTSGQTLPAAGVTFTGNSSATANTLEVAGDLQNVTDTASGVTGNAGAISDGTGTVAYSTTSGIDLDGLATTTVKTVADDAAVQVADGTDFTHGGADAAIVVSVAGATGTQFTPVAAFNDTSLSIDTTGNAGTVGALGTGAVTVNSANGVAATVPNLVIDTAGTSDTISINGAVNVAGTVNLTASAANIGETAPAGKITSATLETQSGTGTLLNDANSFGSLSTSNTTSGDIQFNDTSALGITSVSQTGGNVQIISHGGMTIGGAVTDATGIVSLLDTSATIAESSSVSEAIVDSQATGGTITANLLITQSATGTTLANSNDVASYYAANTTSGNVQLTNAAALAIIFANQAGGDLDITNAGGITLTGTITDSKSGGTVSLDETSAGIDQTSGSITASILNTQSVTGVSMNAISNDVGSFSATNSTSGNLQFNNGAALNVTSISATGGNVQIISAGGMTISGPVADASGIVSLDETSSAMQESGTGAITANMLITQSATGTTLNGVNVVTQYYAANFTSGNVQLNNAAAVSIIFANVTGGNLDIVNTGGIALTGTITDTSGAISLQDTSASINQTSGSITANSLEAQSVTGTSLNAANAVGNFSATNTTSGSIELNNTGALTITAITETGGYVQVINAGGISFTGSVQAAGQTISLLETTAGINQTAASSINTNLLVAQSISGTTLGGTNTINTYVPLTN